MAPKQVIRHFRQLIGDDSFNLDAAKQIQRNEVIEFSDFTVIDSNLYYE